MACDNCQNDIYDPELCIGCPERKNLKKQGVALKEVRKFEYQYNFAIICGRFQPIHKGHESIIRRALAMSKTVGLFIGSANNTGTKQNPFSYELRKEWIEKIFKEEVIEGRLVIRPLLDRENPCDDLSWGKYYKEQIASNFPEKDYGKVELFVYGNDKVRSQWFTPEDLEGIDELVINRGKIDISATKIREALLNRDDELCRKYLSDKLLPYFTIMREILKLINSSNANPTITVSKYDIIRKLFTIYYREYDENIWDMLCEIGKGIKEETQTDGFYMTDGDFYKFICNKYQNCADTLDINHTGNPFPLLLVFWKECGEKLRFWQLMSIILKDEMSMILEGNKEEFEHYTNQTFINSMRR